jgi:uncharacterized membrane protein YeaQ/YmgE (transglycosylase-associated protein family)
LARKIARFIVSLAALKRLGASVEKKNIEEKHQIKTSNYKRTNPCLREIFASSNILRYTLFFGGFMGIFSWIFFGLIAGALAKWIMPGKDPGGWIVTILIGVAGGILGGWIGTLIGFGDVTGWNIKSFALAIVGSLILLGGYRLLKK